MASFQTSYFISGVAPFGDSLVVLAYIPGEEDGEKEFSTTIPARQVFSALTPIEVHRCPLYLTLQLLDLTFKMEIFYLLFLETEA